MPSYDWDEAKRTLNLSTHKLYFIDCISIVEDYNITGLGHRGANGEERFKATGMIFDLCATVVYARRGEAFRIISLRPAKDKERRESSMARYSSDKLKELRAKGASLTDLSRARAMTEAEIDAAIEADPEVRDLPDDWYLQAKLVTPKTPISIRLDEDLLAFFRAQGAGWQTRINNVLRAYKDAVEKPAR